MHGPMNIKLETCVFSKGFLRTVMFAMLLVVSGKYLFIITNIIVNLYAAVNGKVVPVKAFKAYNWNGCISPCVLNFCTR